MTILYKPVKIESAEQAAVLPEGALVRDVRSGFDYRERRALGGYLQADLDAGREVVALVPIEAEEEWTPMVDGHAYVNGKKSEAHVRATVAEWPGAATGHRLVTPWEEA